MVDAGIGLFITAGCLLLYRLVTWLPAGDERIDNSPYYRGQERFATFTMRFVVPVLVVAGAFCILFGWQLNRL